MARSVLLASRARPTTLRSRSGDSLLRRVRKVFQTFLPLSGIRTTLRPVWHFVGLTLLFGSVGSRRLAEFQAAPAAVQDGFWRRLREQSDKRTEELARIAEDSLDDAPLPPVAEGWGRDEWRGFAERLDEHDEILQWDESWSRRARAIRKAQLNPEEDWTPSRDEDPLRDIPGPVYVEALTGEEVPRSGSMRCPLPEHDDLHPSFRVWDQGWRCYGCGKSGTIYDLASSLWGIEPRGSGFVEIHKRLRSVFA